jgi:hypothetical protein
LLSDVASIINNLSQHKVTIEIQNEALGNSYIGKFELDDYFINVNNLENGIEACYNYYLKNGQ